ncbi:hypothetical protein [Streptomyces sp. XC 2026]|uniref:hypothetical protein n=1 Tax=Streptomyces sp. XC 2026 TaxID=2782004 RepID=UPI001906C7E9|nr:hypothetical protein [Streptomyces sp. XC 2026]QQN79749.1 hypothetical protein IPZ77_21730 [Streptomyces sp. XC 2026]QQN80643.1 hypothetical protein IPZ77_26925 [Streptomyces sp. XC 2026]
MVRHQRFADFVTTPPLKGLGGDIELLRRIVQDDPVAVDLLDRALQSPRGRPEENVSNRHISRPAGTTGAAALRRLRKDRPDLHAEVLAGNLSAHAAMVEAGFRHRTISVPVDQPDAAAKALKKNLAPEDLAALAKLLQS